ncbi:MAG: translation initiation factor IF-3 [Flavobacteriales bacterium]|nr:translation initiation factor IF-3 [Flavobacteriales bacterium]
MARKQFRRGRVERKDLHKINEKISAPFVRIVGDVESKIISIKEALHKASQMNLDLVEISPNAEPPVCKLIDYKKFIYDQKKKQKAIKAKTIKVVVKELRFGPNTGEHDFNFKLNHAISFLKDGFKVKAFVFFRGRTIIFKEQGEILLLKLAQALEEYGVIENMPKLEGKKMIMMISAKKKNK